MSALLSLYENPAMVHRLELFTNKFKDRLASMVMDSEVEVAVKACHMLTHIYRWATVFGSKSSDKIFNSGPFPRC